VRIYVRSDVLRELRRGALPAAFGVLPRRHDEHAR